MKERKIDALLPNGERVKRNAVRLNQNLIFTLKQPTTFYLWDPERKIWLQVKATLKGTLGGENTCFILEIKERNETVRKIVPSENLLVPSQSKKRGK